MEIVGIFLGVIFFLWLLIAMIKAWRGSKEDIETGKFTSDDMLFGKNTRRAREWRDHERRQRNRDRDHDA